jgi:DNA replication protein DnaC
VSGSCCSADCGTGKTYLLIGLGLAACERTHPLPRGRYGRLHLFFLDEVLYVQIDPRGAELLFQIITEREERASIAFTSNLSFSEWGSVFPDPRLVAAIVDRKSFNAHILETGTQFLPTAHE